MKLFKFILLLAILSGCQTVTISDSNLKQVRAPVYKQTKWFYWWGITPKIQSVNVNRVCNGRGLAQAQSLDSFGDTLIRAITLGIVYPKTVKVWCK